MGQSEIDAIRALLSSKPRPVGWQQRRQRIEEVGSVWPVAGDIALEGVDIDGMPGEWSTAPGSDASRVLLYFHGGGYCSGSILSHRRLVTEAGRAAKIRTLAIAYRLAPEHPFPAALDDAFSAWRFLRSNGIAAGHIAVGGDSAGGGLTVALINRLRDAGEQVPGCAWLISPWTDLTLSGATLATRDTIDPIIHKSYLAELADAYLPAAVDRRDPRVSPLFADLSGLPPTLIQVGACETLLEDSTRFAAAAGAANVALTLQVWPDMIHAFPMWNAHLEPGRRALAEAGQFIRGQLSRDAG
ncbi:alpha/beta hydrolase [Bradyrhizobium sp.]|uniref:alpha/beta hydrolase n=1 Tax=Bradyrhizobium sp. TaxID=376 RepID=UPI002728BE42|nr:alpha/beta hydrolase [Bradyrhizobium sp.]MDO9296155.1 alpha/beta hydrolase [Bradyrhizobium sp.]